MPSDFGFLTSPSTGFCGQDPHPREFGLISEVPTSFCQRSRGTLATAGELAPHPTRHLGGILGEIPFQGAVVNVPPMVAGGGLEPPTPDVHRCLCRRTSRSRKLAREPFPTIPIPILGYPAIVS